MMKLKRKIRIRNPTKKIKYSFSVDKNDFTNRTVEISYRNI